MATENQAVTTTSPVMNRLVFALSLLGLIVAGYLWRAHATDVTIPCGPGGGCNTVAASPYSRFLGVPVAAYGAGLYLVLAALALARALPAAAKHDRALLSLIVLLAAAGTLVSLYLTYLEIFVLRTICRWCIVSQILILAILCAAAAERLRALWARLPGEVKLLSGLGAFVVVGAGALAVLSRADAPPPPPPPAVTTDVSQKTFDLLLKQARHFKGRQDAPVVIIEFADFQCPACRVAYRSVASRLGTTIPVRFAFRHLPLEAQHPRAVPAAVAAEAAGRQGRFWEMYDALFAATAEDLSDAVFEKAARRIGLDLERFRRDLRDPALAAQIRAEARSLHALGIDTTPSFFVRDASGAVTQVIGGSELAEMLRDKGLLPAGPPPRSPE